MVTDRIGHGIRALHVVEALVVHEEVVKLSVAREGPLVIRVSAAVLSAS